MSSDRSVRQARVSTLHLAQGEQLLDCLNPGRSGMQVPISVRPSDSGGYDLRVHHLCLARPFHRTLDKEDEAHLLGERVVASLDRGELPKWIANACRVKRTTIAGAIHEYRKACPV